MKNFKLKIVLNVLMFFSIITITSSCDDSVDSMVDLSDSNLIEQIQNSKLTEINFNSLPQLSQSTIQYNYVPNGDKPNKSFESPSLGYKVNLVGQERTVDVFFNTEGRELNGGDREDGREDTEGDDDERDGDGDSGSGDGGNRGGN